MASAAIAAPALCRCIADAAADGWPRRRRSWPYIPQKPVFKAPGEAFDAKACANGKKQLSIPNSSANPFLKGIIDREKKAGAEIGLQVKEWENQGQPSQWVQGMEFAIRDKYDIIDLISGIDPSTIEPQVKAAKEAGVKVMTSHFYDPSYKQNPLVSSSLTIGFGEVGTILADWATVATDGKANIASDRLATTCRRPFRWSTSSRRSSPPTARTARSSRRSMSASPNGAPRSSPPSRRRCRPIPNQHRDPDLRLDVAVRRPGASPGRQDRRR